MKRLHKLILFIGILMMSYACTECEDLPADGVFIRIENGLNEDITNISLGTSIQKGVSSYASCSYTTQFDRIDEGETTEYIEGKGKFLAYKNLRIHVSKEGRDIPWPVTVGSDNMEIMAMTLGAERDSVGHPFSDEHIVGYDLPQGYYTFYIKAKDPDKNRCYIDITLD